MSVSPTLAWECISLASTHVLRARALAIVLLWPAPKPGEKKVSPPMSRGELMRLPPGEAGQAAADRLFERGWTLGRIMSEGETALESLSDLVCPSQEEVTVQQGFTEGGGAPTA